MCQGWHPVKERVCSEGGGIDINVDVLSTGGLRVSSLVFG